MDPTDAQILLGLAMFAATAVLAVATCRYMKATDKMANSMNQQSEVMLKEFEFRSMPLVEEKVFQKTTGLLDPVIAVTISNVGFYPVYCNEIEIKLYGHDEQDEDAYRYAVRVDKWIEKDRVLSREYTLDFRRVSIFNHPAAMKNKAIAQLTFNYRSIANHTFADTKFIRY